MPSVPRLAVYGSLAPGRENHYLLSKYPGTWSSGRVRGDVINAGWGAAGGYLGLIPRDDGPWVAVQVFESKSLADAWLELDAFEGIEYQRVLIPVYSDDAEARLLYLANIYALAR
jgi:gamma-glutamylcyclotransferase (GGCT)/AIG2-like uncharacterized protein YtfP